MYNRASAKYKDPPTTAPTDRDALVALHNSTDGPNWSESTGWDTDAPLSDWYGVTANDEGRVVELSLGANNLRGPIPPELGGLSKLETLWLATNKLTGPIPSELGNLTALKGLYLGNNQLSGPIPRELGNLAALQSLDLGANTLSGHIPPELGALSKLRKLILFNNKLTGHIPPQLRQLGALQYLNLAHNELDGPIPPELGGLGKLSTLWLQNNKLTGPIPPELRNLVRPGTLQPLGTAAPAAAAAATAACWAGIAPPPRGRQLSRRSSIGRGWTSSRGYNESSHGSDRGSSRGSSCGSSHGSNHGGYDFSASDWPEEEFSSVGASEAVLGKAVVAAGDTKGIGSLKAESPLLRSPRRLRPTCSPERQVANQAERHGTVQAAVQAAKALGGGTAEKVTILENMAPGEAPIVRSGRGVHLSVPRRSLPTSIGPITVEETCEVVDGSDDSLFVIMQVVHCLPSPISFPSPLALDFVVRDGNVGWWERASVREEILREYQVLFKQSEDEPWQEMNQKDLSVVWDDQGATCLRAQVKHFTWFGHSKRATTADAYSVSRHGENSVLVYNKTSCWVHLSILPVSFNSVEERGLTAAVNVGEVGVQFGNQARKERLRLPAATSFESVAPGGRAELFFIDGAKEAKVVVCFLPEKNATCLSATPGSTTPNSGATPPQLQGQHSPTSPISVTAPQTVAPISAAMQPQVQGQQSPTSSNQMLWWACKTMRTKRRWTLLPAAATSPFNRTVAIETADFGVGNP